MRPRHLEFVKLSWHFQNGRKVENYWRGVAMYSYYIAM
jgi:hypothetical protein